MKKKKSIYQGKQVIERSVPANPLLEVEGKEPKQPKKPACLQVRKGSLAPRMPCGLQGLVLKETSSGTEMSCTSQENILLKLDTQDLFLISCGFASSNASLCSSPLPLI